MTAFEWDDAKNLANQHKHGIGFDVVLAFDWAAAFVEADERYDYGEQRFRAFGRIDGKGYCIVFTPRAGAIRIISARPMHEKESRRYGL